MNICLVSNSTSGIDFSSPVIDELSELGLRVVVLFLKPQSRHLWNRQNVVFFAPGSHVEVFGIGLEATYRQKLEQARDRWLVPLRAQTGHTGRILLGLERRGYRLARVGGSRIAGRLEATVAMIDSKLKQRAYEPFEKLPQGITAYGVIHALDKESVDVSRAAALRSGALFLPPETSDVKAAYEQAIMHWLKD